MATSVTQFLQGSGQPAVPGVYQANTGAVPGVTFQGSSPSIQGSTVPIQGSSPVIQGSSPVLQPAVNPQTLPASTVIKQPAAPTPPKVTPVAAPVAPVNPNATPAAAAPVLPDRTNDINQNLAALEASKSMLTGGLGSIQSSLSSLLGKYDVEAGSNQAAYGDQSANNKNGFLKNVQSALLNAAQGRQGLFGVLSSLGALNGSGVELANHAVQQGANADISGANDNFATNQSGLDTALKGFTDADAQRRQDAEKARVDAEANLRAQVAQNQQSIYGNLANDHADMGQSDQAKSYSDLLASLFPTIAQNSVPSSGPTYSAAGYAAPTLQSYLSGGTTVNATPASGLAGLPGLTAYVAPTKRRDA